MSDSKYQIKPLDVLYGTWTDCNRYLPEGRCVAGIFDQKDQPILISADRSFLEAELHKLEYGW